MDDINNTTDSHQISPSAKFPHEESISRLETTLSIDDEESQCYKENFAMIRKLLVGSSDFSIAVSPEGYTIIKIGDIPFIMDDIDVHNHEHTIKTGGHQYYELNRLKQNYEKDLPIYEEWLKAKEICGSVDSLISIINGAGNGFISKNIATNSTKTYASGFSFHPFQGEDIYGQYICKRFYNNATKFVPIHGENFISCKRVYRGDLHSLSFRPIADTDILGYTAKDGVLDVCYTTEQYVKKLNDQIYEAYLRHKPFEDFYTNLTIASPELKEEFMCNLFLVVLSQYSPHELHISVVIEYAKTYFKKFNISTVDSDKFFQDMFSQKHSFQHRLSKILGLHNKTFSLLKERISDIQDEYPEYDIKELTLGRNLSNTNDYYSKKNIALSSEKKSLSTEKKDFSDSEIYKSFPYIGKFFSSREETRASVYKFIYDKDKTLLPYIQVFFDHDNGNAVLLSLKELKYLDTWLMQIYAILGVEFNMIAYNDKLTIVTNKNELLVDRYSIGKVLLSTDEFPDISYLPTQDDMMQFYDKLKTKYSNPWQRLIEIIIKTSDTILADPKNVFDLRKIYVPCRDGWIVISQTHGIKKINDKPDTGSHLFVSLIKNIVPVPQKATTRVNIRDDIKSFRDKRNSIKRYQTSSKKEIKIQQQALLNTLNKRNIQKKDIQYNAKLSEEFSKKTQYTDLKELPFTTAEQVLANIDIYKTTKSKRSLKYVELLMRAGYTAKVLENMQFFAEHNVCQVLLEVKDWNIVLPLIKKITSSNNQKIMIDEAFRDINSKIADFIDYLPDGVLNHFQLSAIIQNPVYKNIDRTKYRHICKELLFDERDMAYIKLLPIDEVMKVLPIVDILSRLGLSFLTDCIKKEKKMVPVILDRFSEIVIYKDVSNLKPFVKEIKEYCKEDNFLAKKIRACNDVPFILDILSTHLLKNLDQSFLLDILQRIGLEPQAILADDHDKEAIDDVYKSRLDDFTGPLALAIVDELSKQGYLSVVLDAIDMFVPLPDNYFSDDGAKKFIKEKGIEIFSTSAIKYFHNLSSDTAKQIHAIDGPEKYKILYENKTAFSSFPPGFLSKKDAKVCLDTYGLDIYATYSFYFDDIPSESLKTVYEDLYNKKEWKKIVKYIDYFIDCIPSGVYRSLQRHGYIHIVDTNAPDPTQQKQVKKYLAPQEFESVLMASVSQNVTLPSQGKYIDGTKRGKTEKLPIIILDDVIEEYDSFCMPYDYFYHNEDIQLSLGDKTVHVIKRTRENGNSFGFDTIYLVDYTQADKVYVKKIADSLADQKYISINAAHIEGENIVVELSTGEFKETYEPIVDIRNDIKTIIEKKEEEKHIKTFTPFQKQVATEMFLDDIKKEANFSNELSQRLVVLFQKKGGDIHYFLKKIGDDIAYCAKYPDIIFRAITTCIEMDTNFTQEESNMLGELLIHTVDWKKYARCPLNYGYMKRIFSMNNKESEKKGNMLIDKLIQIYSPNFIEFVKDFGDNEKIISRCVATEKKPPGFCFLVYKAKNIEGAAYLIKKRKESFFQDLVSDIKNASLQQNECQVIFRFYNDYIKKNNDEEEVKASLYLQILNQDKVMLDFAADYLSIFLDERGTGNTIQMLHYLYKVGALDKLQIPLISPDLLKDIVTFSATYPVPEKYLQKITEDMMQCLRGPSHTYTGDKELITSALRFLLTLVPDTLKYFTTYAQTKKYPTESFISTVYTPFA